MQTWIGPHPKPVKWMNTWKEKHPDWNYILWDEESIKELDINCKAFDYYWEKEMWPGVADIIRYHALYKYGGFQPGADSICINPIDEIIDENELYTVASHALDKENWIRTDGLPEDGQKIHFIDRNNKEHKDSISPIHGAKKGHWFIREIINEINQLTKFDKPYKTTGNVLCEKMVKKYNPEIKILPMNTFIPRRTARTTPPREYKYIGNGKVYSEHYYFTTNKLWTSEY
jgi:mannosyltransferase OCH1-like enzyme